MKNSIPQWRDAMIIELKHRGHSLSIQRAFPVFMPEPCLSVLSVQSVVLFRLRKNRRLPRAEKMPFKSADWIDYLDKRKAMEIGVASIDFFNAVLAHEHRGVRIVQNVAAQMRHFGNHFSQ